MQAFLDMEVNLTAGSGRVFMAGVLLLIFCIWVPILGRAQNASVSSSAANVVNIGAVFTLNSFIGRAAQPAILAAIDDVNSDSSILEGRKLNVIFQDTNCSGFLGTVEGIFLKVQAYVNRDPFFFVRSLILPSLILIEGGTPIVLGAFKN